MLSLALAMTTAPRRHPTLFQALLSLREAGFHEDVHVFAEPGTFASVNLVRPGDEQTFVHENAFKRGCFGNWKGSLEWLLEHTNAPWLMIVQDDTVWCPGAAEVLRAKVGDRGAWSGFYSPYISPVNVTNEFADGWNECRAGWNFWGALALCLERAASEELLKHPRFAKHSGTAQVDAVVAASMLELQRPSFVHVPSLVDHIGETSTIGSNDDPAGGRRGYRFGNLTEVKDN